MQRPPFLEYIKSKDIDLWQVIQNNDFYFEIEDSKTKMMKETSYELLKDNKKKKLDKNNEAKMTLYNALSRKEYERVFMCKTAKEVWRTLIITHQGNSQVKNFKIDLFTQEYEKFSISNEEIIGNLKVYEIILSSHDEDEDEDEDKEEDFNLIVRNLWKLFKKGNRFERENHFGNSGDKFDRGRGGRNKDSEEPLELLKKGNRFERENRFGNGGDRFDRGHRSKGVGSSKGKHNCYGCGSKNYFIDDYPRVKVKKEFGGGA
ncbi:hypothetical protein Tco_0719179 [Tanacetum coccineum]